MYHMTRTQTHANGVVLKAQFTQNVCYRLLIQICVSLVWRRICELWKYLINYVQIYWTSFMSKWQQDEWSVPIINLTNPPLPLQPFIRLSFSSRLSLFLSSFPLSLSLSLSPAHLLSSSFTFFLSFLAFCLALTLLWTSVLRSLSPLAQMKTSFLSSVYLYKWRKDYKK